MDEIADLARDLESAAKTLPRRARGAGAKVADQMAATAQANALAAWTRYGTGMQGAAGTIRARMSSDKDRVEGYVIADGEGAFQSEFGTTEHAPAPVIGPVVDQFEKSWADAMEDAGGDVLR
jgi:hypothetical protein